MKQTGIAALICAVLLFLSVAFVDKPVAKFLVHHQGFNHGFDVMAAPSLLPIPLALIYLIFFTFEKLSGRPQSAFTQLFLMLSVAIIVATAAKDELKFIVGRPWAGEWLRYGMYKLQPFNGSPLYDCFPSGHTTIIAAPMFVLWWHLPQYRAVWMAIIFSVMIGLVGAGFHYVGDVIGGFFLGMAVGAATVALMPGSTSFLEKRTKKLF